MGPLRFGFRDLRWTFSRRHEVELGEALLELKRSVLSFSGSGARSNSESVASKMERTSRRVCAQQVQTTCGERRRQMEVDDSRRRIMPTQNEHASHSEVVVVSRNWSSGASLGLKTIETRKQCQARQKPRKEREPQVSRTEGHY